MLQKFLLAAILSLALVGCRTYEGANSAVSTQRFNEDHVLVEVRGDSYTTQDKLKDYVVLRAAEETIRAGYEFFTIVNVEDKTKHQVYIKPARTVTKSVTTKSTGKNGTTYTKTKRTFYEPAEENHYYYPGEDVVVRFVTRDEVNDRGNALDYYEASYVIQSLGPTYIKAERLRDEYGIEPAPK